MKATDAKQDDGVTDDDDDDDDADIHLAKPISATLAHVGGNRAAGGSLGDRRAKLGPQSSLKSKDSGSRFGWLEAATEGKGGESDDLDGPPTPTMAAHPRPLGSAREIVLDEDAPVPAGSGVRR